MHVLHVVDTLDHHPGRFAVGLPGLLAELRDADVTSDVVSGVSHDEWVERGLAAETIAIIDEEDGHAAMGEVAPLAQRAEIVHIHTSRAEIAKFAVAAARAARKPYVLSPWGELGGFGSTGRAIGRWLEARRFRRKFHDARALTCASELERAGVVGHSLHARTVLLRPGFTPVPAAVDADPDAGEHMGMPWADGRPMAAMLGDFDGGSGIAEFIHAVAAIPAAQEWHFVIAGRPVDSWLPRFQQEVERKNVAAQLAMVVYPDVEQQAAIIDAAEFVVLASTLPSTPYGGLQGMAAGKPILVSEDSGFASLADHGAGLAVGGNVQGLRSGLEDMLSRSRESRLGMGASAAANVQRLWSWTTVLPAWLELYRACR